MGLAECGPVTEYSAAKLKRGQFNTVLKANFFLLRKESCCSQMKSSHKYLNYRSDFFPPAAEIWAGLADNFREELSTLKSEERDLVWQAVCPFQS